MKKFTLFCIALLFLYLNSCNQKEQGNVMPDPVSVSFPFQNFVIKSKVTDLGFAILDTLNREMAFVHGEKSSSGELIKVNQVIYQLPERNIIYKLKIADNYFVDEFTALTDDATITFKFNDYDLAGNKAKLSIINERTNVYLLTNESVIINKNTVDNIKFAQKLGTDMAKGGRLPASASCDNYIDLTRVLLSFIGCVTSYAPTFTLIEVALAAAPSTLGISIIAATLASAGTLLACYEAGNDLNNRKKGICKEVNNIPESITQCLISALTGLFTKDIKQIGTCYLSAADALFEKGAQPIPISQTANGYSTGDPHLTTTDNLSYSFQGYGEFVVVKSVQDNFEVQVRQEDVKNTGMATLNTAVAVQTGSDVVCVTAMPDNVYINGVSQGLNFSKITLKNGASVGRAINNGLQICDITTQNGDIVRIRFHNSYLLDYVLYLKDNRKGKVIGLMGNFDGTTDNDLQIRNGNIIKNEFDQLYPRFADSWRIQANQSFFYYPSGKTTENYTKRDFPQSKPILSVEAMQRAEALCRNAGINTEPHLNNCILDVALLNDNSLINSALLAKQVDTRSPMPSVTKFIEDSSFTATYRIENENLIVKIIGLDFFYSTISVDINQNNKIDSNIDRAYATGVNRGGNPKEVSFCSVYILDSKSFTEPCGTALSAGSLVVNNNIHTYSIPLNELDPTNSKKQIFISAFIGDKAYPKFEGNNYFVKPLVITIR